MAASASPSVSPSKSPSISPSASKSPSVSPSISPSFGLEQQNIFLVGADTSGDIQQMNGSKSDDGTAIYYELETQELEFGNRIINKRLEDKLVVFSENADDSNLQIIPDEKDAISIDSIDLGKRVANTTLPPIEAHFVTLRWSGNATKKSPILEGFYFNKVEDKGVQNG
jgi:hypothetical protein